MKFILLLFCLFGLVFADTSKSEWITSAIGSLTSDLTKLTNAANNHSHPAYLKSAINKLKSKVNNFLVEMKQFPVNATLEGSFEMGSTLWRARGVYEFTFMKMEEEFHFIELETIRLYKTIARERLKFFGLTIASHQYIANNASMPSPTQLILDVEAIIYKEQVISHQIHNPDGRLFVMQTTIDNLYKDLDERYKNFNKTLESSMDFGAEGRSRFQDVSQRALSLIASLKNKTCATKKAEILQNGLDLVIRINTQTLKILPIEDRFRVGQLVWLGEHFIRSLSNLESLVDTSNEL